MHHRHAVLVRHRRHRGRMQHENSLSPGRRLCWANARCQTVTQACQIDRLRAGEAQAIFRRAEATAKGLGELSSAIQAEGGGSAASMRIAEQYLAAFGNIAKTGAPAPHSSTMQAITLWGKLFSQLHVSASGRLT